MKYRKKPVIIEAFQMTRSRMTDRSDWPEWLHEALDKPTVEFGSLCFVESTFLLTTPEGILAINADDWVIRGVQGELYPIKPDIFEMTYEKVEY